MRILVQWATDPSTDWVSVDSHDWRRLPRKLEPTGGEVLDASPGWVAALNVQSVVFDGYDHYVVLPMMADNGEALAVYAWCDDPEDWAGKEYGSVWTFRTLAPDAGIGGRYNTRQSSTVFLQGERLQKELDCPGHTVACRRWEQWVMPPSNTTRHGIWMPEELHKESQTGRTATRWDEWLEGVPDDVIEGGRVVR